MDRFLALLTISSCIGIYLLCDVDKLSNLQIKVVDLGGFFVQR